jgi:NhaP-type Na+/H+ or K+/H+ antiporter
MKIKDSVLLLITGIIFTIAAWMYWHYTVKYGDRIFIMGVVIVLMLEKRRLKLELKELGNSRETFLRQ